MKKRAMALALSVAMVLSSVPLSVSAEEPEVSVEVVEAEAEANEAQESGEAEVTEEPVEAEEIVAEPQIAVESLEEVPEAATIEAEELAPVDNAVATAGETHNITDVTISLGEVPLGAVTAANQTQSGALDSDLTTTYDPTKTKMGEVLDRLKLETGDTKLTVNYKSVGDLTAGKDYSLTLAGNYENATTANSPAYLCINFGSPYDDLKTVYVKFNIEKKSIVDDAGNLTIKVSYDLTDIVGNESFEYNGKPIELPITVVNDAVEDEVTKATTNVELKKAETAQTSGNCYMVEFGSYEEKKFVSAKENGDITNVGATGTKAAMITGTGNYTGTGYVVYEVAQRKYKEGDITIPGEEHFKVRTDAAGEKVSNEDTLLKKIKDVVGGTEKALTTKDVTLTYYRLDDGKEVKVDSFPKDLAPTNSDKKPETYHYYVSLTGNGNFQKADTGLMGTFVLEPAATTLEDVCADMIKVGALTTSYSYTGGNLMGTVDVPGEILETIKNQFKKYDSNYADVKVVPGKDAKGDPVEAINVGDYSVTVKKVDAQDETKVLETKVIPVKVTPMPLTNPDGTLQSCFKVETKWGDNTLDHAAQGINYDGSFTGNEPVVTFTRENWPSTVTEAEDKVFEKGKDYTITWTADPTTGKVDKVTITGGNNYKGSIDVKVEQDKKVNLGLLKEGAKVKLETNGKIKNADSIEIYDKAGKRIPAVSDNGFTEYTFSETDGCTEGQHVMAAKTHSVTVTAGTNGKCIGTLVIEFTFDGTSFAETYMADNRNVDNPTVGIEIDPKKAPHETVMVKAQNGKNVKSLLDAKDYTCCYVWADDPETDVTKKLTIDPSNNAWKATKAGENVTVASRTFPETGTWNLVMKPTTKLEKGSLSGELVMPFKVEPRKFVEQKNGQTSTPGIIIGETKDTRTVTWMGGNAVSEDALGHCISVSYFDGKNTIRLKYKADATKDEPAGFEVASVSGNDKVGTATVTLRGMNKYSSDTIDVEVTIKKKSLAGATVKVNGGYQGGASLKVLPEDVTISFPESTAIDAHEGNVPTSAYTVSDPVITNGKDFGLNSRAKVTITAAADSNYTGSVDQEFTITKADIGTAAFEILVDKVYFFEGEKIEPEVKLHNNRTNEDVDISDSSKFTVSYENQDKVGTAKVTVKAAATNEYYTGTATAEYTIADAELGRIELKADSYVYTGSEIKDVVKAVYGTDEKELKNWTAVYSHNTDAGLASVVVTVVSGGKTLSLEKTFEITPAPIQNAVIGNLEETYEYTGDVVRPEVTVTVNGRTLVKNVDYQLMNTEETGLGEKGLAVHGINNYAGDILKHFTVVPASLKGAKVVVKNAVYNGKVRKPAVTVSVGGKRLKAANYTVTYDNTAKIGAKTATIEGKGNYTGTVTAAYKVTPAKAVISKVTAGTKKLTVAVKAQTGAKYQIFYRQKGTKKWSVVLSAKASKAITVKSGVKYQVRVRAYAVMDGAKSFGTLSTVKTSAKVK